MLPLEGVTVVSLEHAVALPFATRHLAELGARVIKVERPGRGDFARDYDRAVRGGMSAHFSWLNRSKESLTLDLKVPRAREVLDLLVARADVVAQNLGPGAAARLGLDAQTLVGRHPALVAVNVSGYGPAGPYRARKAYDMLVQAESGLIAVTGSPQQPAKAGFAAGDVAAGSYVIQAVLAALLRRARSGAGAALDVAMLDALTEWMGYPVQTVEHTGQEMARSGISHQSIAPYDAYRTADGDDVLIGVQNDGEWRRLAEGPLARPELVDDPAFATNVARVRNREGTDAVVAAEVAKLGTAELEAGLDAAGIAYARVNTVAGVLAHPQLAARGRWVEVGSPVGPVRQSRPVVEFPGENARLDPVPALGAHTDTILRELDLSAEEIAGLRADGAI
ncbi:Crotonobetainyl-CoA:carnitine CoA-transferase CaiB [Parafrankia irregularis]|uniref:Crotonobetainyl-CoA:carnitine CoA-transferase CaiB n=1 Tax=Parafrankia irregularis TaxID=795642 RepID=A0A0S4QDX2_9ACTN|nr:MULTISPECIES: CaiB/BaiF CoA-transferase family protein [Parafrankia]MBE3199615.1 CoA transferase [Parafrankia sp. CH37]CUU53717.1 Crotonobetainyl-CoA:carnitine CoA-transferase CaiB [Parafrankia irregularis]